MRKLIDPQQIRIFDSRMYVPLFLGAPPPVFLIVPTTTLSLLKLWI